MENKKNISWEAFDNGQSIGELGGEDGVIERDDAFKGMARITLESNTLLAPFTVTCNIFGWMVHTRYFGKRNIADSEFEKMKPELARISALLPGDPGDLADQDFADLTQELKMFVEKFP